MGRPKVKMDEARAIELRAQGYGYREISKMIGTPMKTIQSRLTAMGNGEHLVTKECTVCGTTYKAQVSNSIYCSPKCHDVVKVANRKKERRELIAYAECTQCGKEYKPTLTVKAFCSVECKDRHTSESQAIKIYYKDCATCFSLFVSKYSNKKYCSHRCGSNYSRINKSRMQRRLKKCKTCDVWFWRKTNRSVCCSEYCAKKYKNHLSKLDVYKRKRLMKSNGEIDKDISITKLLKKYNNKCYLCNSVVSLQLDAYDSLYPTIEHVIPVSRGGTHTWDNVMLSCRRCNCKKHAMTLEEYLDKKKEA